MNKDVHDIDELFRSGLEGHEETPSAGVKESLDAALDKKDAEEYKKRFIIWKRAALLLLLLLAGFVLYESGILRTGSGHLNEKIAGKKIKSSSGDKQGVVYQNNAADNTNNDKPGSLSTETKNNNAATNERIVDKNNTIQFQPQQADLTAPAITGISDKQGSGERTSGTKDNSANRKLNPLIVNRKNEKTFIPPVIDKNTIRFNANSDLLSGKKIIFLQPAEKYSIAKAAGLLVNNITQPPLPAVSDSLLKNSSAKNKKIRFFNPLWMITGFASYDQAGYRLDSDEPSAVKSIRFREAHEPSFSAGVLLTRQLTPRWGLQSGIVYSNSAIGMKPQKTYAFVDPTGDVAYKYITSSGYAYFKPGFGPQPAAGDSLTTAEAKHTLEHISVPLVIKHTISNKRISITPGAGIEANMITRANLEVDIEDPFNREIVVVRKLNGTKSFYWSFTADAELRYNINKKMSVSVRPVYRQALSPITKNNVVETFPRSFGIGTGVTIKF
jgi:hypothetical protein